MKTIVIVDIKEIARRLYENDSRSDDPCVSEVIVEAIIESINPELVRLTNEVIAEMYELEHPEPRNVEEYNERLGD